MFDNCISLTSLDLSHFNTSQVTYISDMFSNCKNLEYINLYNFTGEKLYDDSLYYENMFNNIPDNAVICIQENNNNSKIVNQIKNKTCIKIDCSENWRLIQKKINTKNNLCIDDCYIDPEYKYEYNGKCYNNCSFAYILNYNISSYNIHKDELKNCLSCSNDNFNFGLCIECNDNYYPKENDTNNIGIYINCYDKSILKEGYYFDKNDSLYKKCYDSCQTCEQKGNKDTHNCVTCKSDYSLIPIKNNCIKLEKEEIIDNIELDEIINNTELTEIIIDYIIKIEAICTEEKPFEKIANRECVKNCDINDIINNICILKFKKNETENEKENKDDNANNNNNIDKEKEEEKKIIKEQDIFLENVEVGFTSDTFNTSDIESGKETTIVNNKMKITLTTTDNQKNSTNNNMTSVDLGDCEIALRKYYNLSDEKILFMKKIDINQTGYKIPKIEYDVYCKLNGSNLIKLDKSVCSNTKVDISIPIVITESLDKLNTSSGYFNDICYIASSDSGTYISFKDRKNEYINGNKAVCQDDCDFSEYDYKINRAKCSCKVKQSSDSTGDMIIYKDKLFKNFINIKNIANINIMKCTKELFNKEGISNNIGFYITASIIVFHIISVIIFHRNKKYAIEQKINNLILAMEKNNINENIKKKILLLKGKK